MAQLSEAMSNITSQKLGKMTPKHMKSSFDKESEVEVVGSHEISGNIKPSKLIELSKTNKYLENF